MDSTSPLESLSSMSADMRRTNQRQRAINALDEAVVLLANERERIPLADLQAYQTILTGYS